MPKMTGARGTRVPSGGATPRDYARPARVFSSLWPGITWGDNACCSCTWGYLGGARQVKVRHSACAVHIPGRDAEPSG